MKSWETRIDRIKGVGHCCVVEHGSKSVIFLIVTFTMIVAFTFVFGSVVMYLVDMIADLESTVEELQQAVEKYQMQMNGIKRMLLAKNVSHDQGL